MTCRDHHPRFAAIPAASFVGEAPAFNPAPGYADARPAAAPVASDIPQDNRWAPGNLPASGIREEYRQSGQWRTDAPTAPIGTR